MTDAVVSKLPSGIEIALDGYGFITLTSDCDLDAPPTQISLSPKDYRALLDFVADSQRKTHDG